MSEVYQPDQRIETRRILRMLNGTAEMAQHATLTGALDGGAPAASAQVNRAVRFLEQKGMLPPGFFEPLSQEASFAEVGVAASQIVSYLSDDETEATSSSTHDERGGHNVVNIGFGGLKELRELKGIGEMIRSHLPEWLMAEETASRAAEAVVDAQGDPREMAEVDSRLTEIGAHLQAVAEQIRRDDLNLDERLRLAEQLTRLGAEQAQLARTRAAVRPTIVQSRDPRREDE
jgi:hypothetical protein